MASSQGLPSSPGHIESLTRSFALVPPAAVPALLSCVLASAPSLSPSQLFSSLLDAFPRRIEELLKEGDSKLDSASSGFVVCYVSSLFHLAKNGAWDESGDDVGRQLIWRVTVPLLRMTIPNDKGLLKQIEEMLCDAVCSWLSWEILEETLVPFCLGLICLHVGIDKNEKLTLFYGTVYTSASFYGDNANDRGSLPVTIVCHVLTSLLGMALRIKADNGVQEGEYLHVVESICPANGFACKLMFVLSQMVIEMLSQSIECRSFAICFLLPSVVWAFSFIPSSEIMVQGVPHSLSRYHFSRRIWECCRSLFALGKLECLDALKILSLYSKFFFSAGGYKYPAKENFDMRDEHEFWVEIHRGLVDKDFPARKASLYILKLSLGQQAICPEPEGSAFPATGSDSKVTISQTNVAGKGLSHSGMTRKERWAHKEAKSLGVGGIQNFSENSGGKGRWKAFFLLYEMLEEYGTHLVEAAWTHQVYLFFQYAPHDLYVSNSGSVAEAQMETLEGMFSWLAVLWERGLFHENPQVRCLILQSFLSIDWESHRDYAKQVPEKFIIGPFMQGLNDVVQHKDFGLKGVYTSKAIQGATNFLSLYSLQFSRSVRIAFLCRLASVARQESLGRPGLMALAFCLSSVACGSSLCPESNEQCYSSKFKFVEQEEVSDDMVIQESSELLETLGIIIQRSKQHFNPRYRLKVCEQVIHTAYSVIWISEVPLDILLHFLSNVPNEFTDFGGPLRRKVLEWFYNCCKEDGGRTAEPDWLLRNLCNFPTKFIVHQFSSGGHFCFDDDDVKSWGLEAQRWSRVFFLVVSRMQHFDSIFAFLKYHGSNICKCDSSTDWVPAKFLILASKFIEEFRKWSWTSCHHVEICIETEVGSTYNLVQMSLQEVSVINDRFRSTIMSIAEELKQFATSACNRFWSPQMVNDADLPKSIKGRLGGPSQRRLDFFTATAVLQAMLSVEVVAGVFICHLQVNGGTYLKSLLMFLWNFTWSVIESSKHHRESGAEIQLAAFEALVPVLRTLSSSFPLSAFDILCLYNRSSHQNNEDKLFLDFLLISFLESINNVLANGLLTRSRRAVLMGWKWLCLHSILSIPYNIAAEGACQHSSNISFSDASLRCAMVDVVESLETAGESSALPMFRCVRLILRLLSPVGIASLMDSSSQVTQQLVHSSWMLHLNCNKRYVAPISALLSSVLHPSLFNVLSLHEVDGNKKGPLKWFVEQLLEEGTKSPRTIRLLACHLTGLWLLYPKTIKFYIKELKVLSLYGSVAFDEDFEAELSENVDARLEVPFLAQSPFSEFAEAFINTEMYARVSVAILFFKLASKMDSEQEDALAISSCGKSFLLEFLTSAVNDRDLSKELYKKYSGVHRRKVRAWQMICVLSCYVEDDIVQQVTSMLHICLYRNNLSAVRQYLELFAIQIYLKFPSLTEKQLIPILRDYNMRPQALSSYVFISANVIIHARDASVQLTHLNELLPPIIPLLTSHHHSLRGFTQVLVYHALCKMVHVLQPDSEILEKKCFKDLKSYLENNADCSRLRASMEGFLDSFDPETSTTPGRIFNPKNESSDFECVPVSLMEQITKFLDAAREDLRYSMEKDMMTIKNESLSDGAYLNTKTCESETAESLSDVQMDFQKKISLHKHEKHLSLTGLNWTPHIFEFPNSLHEMEKEDLLLSQIALSRSQAREKFRESRQQFILVASLLDHIPNLAGLARTCEVFKATGLVVADASITHDKQFQLISVTAEKWIPVIEVPVRSLKVYLERKRLEGFSILGLEQTANSIPLDQYSFPTMTVLVLGREKEGIPVDIIHILDACVEIPQLGVIRSLNVHVSGAIALWEYIRQQRCKPT